MVKEAKEVNEISVGLSVCSVQRQAQAFNARSVALNAGSEPGQNQVNEFSVQVSVGRAFNARAAFNAELIALNVGSEIGKMAKFRN